MNKPFLIGISGYKRTGKDSVCSILLDLFKDNAIEAERRAFADALKEEVVDFLAYYFNDKYTWKQYYEMTTSDEHKEKFRPLWQWWGSEGRRWLDGENYWIDLFDEFFYQETEASVGIVPDVRFVNEAEYIKNKGGVMIRVNRPHYNGDSHISENNLNDYNNWDYVVVNDGDLEALKVSVENIYKDILKRMN